MITIEAPRTCVGFEALTCPFPELPGHEAARLLGALSLWLQDGGSDYATAHVTRMLVLMAYGEPPAVVEPRRARYRDGVQIVTRDSSRIVLTHDRLFSELTTPGHARDIREALGGGYDVVGPHVAPMDALWAMSQMPAVRVTDQAPRNFPCSRLAEGHLEHVAWLVPVGGRVFTNDGHGHDIAEDVVRGHGILTITLRDRAPIVLTTRPHSPPTPPSERRRTHPAARNPAR